MGEQSKLDRFLRQMELDALPMHAESCEYWIAELNEATDLDQQSRSAIEAEAYAEAEALASELTSLQSRFSEVVLPGVPMLRSDDALGTLRAIHVHIGQVRSALRNWGKPPLTQKELFIARTIHLHPSSSSERIAEIMTNKYKQRTDGSAVRRAFTQKLRHWGFTRAGKNAIVAPLECGQSWERPIVGFDEK